MQAVKPLDENFELLATPLTPKPSYHFYMLSCKYLVTFQKKKAGEKDTFVFIILNMAIEQISQNCILAQGKKREGPRRPLSFLH